MVLSAARSSAALAVIALLAVSAGSPTAVASSTKVLPNPGFVPPLLYSLAHSAPGSFLDITAGANAVFSGVSCCSASPGVDLASGLGSPLANEILQHLQR